MRTVPQAHGGAGPAGSDPAFTPFGGEGMALGREGAPAAEGVEGVSHANAKEVRLLRSTPETSLKCLVKTNWKCFVRAVVCFVRAVSMFCTSFFKKRI